MGVPFNVSSFSVRQKSHGCNFQTIIHSFAWMDLAQRLRAGDSSLRKATNTLPWDLLSMALSRIDPTLRPYDTYLPPINSRQVQIRPLNSHDEVQSWMQLHRLNIIDDQRMWQSRIPMQRVHPIPRKIGVPSQTL